MRLTSCGHATSTATRGPAGLCEKCQPLGPLSMRLRQAARIAEDLGFPAFARELDAIAAEPLEHAQALELVERSGHEVALAAAPRTDVVILCGPPCSGKTTYAREHAVGGDVVLDYDVVFAELSGLPLYAQPFELRAEAERVFRERADALTRGWIIRSAPLAQHRAALREKHHAQSIVLAVPAEICVARLMRSDRPLEVKERQRADIEKWWAEFTPSSSPDERVEPRVETPTPPLRPAPAIPPASRAKPSTASTPVAPPMPRSTRITAPPSDLEDSASDLDRVMGPMSSIVGKQF